MFDNLNSKQKKILIAIGVVVTIGIIYFIYNKTGSTQISQVDDNILISTNSTKEGDEKESEDAEIIIIHITGAVNKPGIVRLREGARIEDAINEADGLTEDADISNVNLAYVLEDGIRIKIPSVLETESLDNEVIMDSSGENIIEESEPISSVNKTININKATETEFQSLPGIGAALATKIVEYREQNGKFSKIEDIKNVSGIGDSKYDKIKDLISIR